MLFLGQAANQQTAPGFCDDVAVQAFHDDGLLAGGVHEAVPAAVEADIRADDGVAVLIGLDVVHHGAPAAQVAPAQVFGDDELDLLALERLVMLARLVQGQTQLYDGRQIKVK